MAGAMSGLAGSTSRALGSIVLLKLVVSAIVLAIGFRAVSDDDFARVVIAESWAHAPKLDPTGTSWLPLPFWLTGSVMLVAGRSIEVARVVAIALGALSMLAVYASAMWCTRDRTLSLVSALVACVLPWSARLGVSTVPELPCAALTLVAMASTVAPVNGTRRLLGGLSLFAAALCRYEPWFVAIFFCGANALDLVRGPKSERWKLVLASVVALAAPIAWIWWNARVHGAPLHFVDRVAAYNQAVSHESIPRRVIGYVFAVARAEPEFLVLLSASAIALPAAARRESFAPLARPLLFTGLLLVALTWSGIRGGAPTHHPERSMFVIFLVLAIAAGQILARYARDASVRPARKALAIALFVVAAGSFPVRRWVLQSESYADRAAEVAIGEQSARLVRPGDQTFLEVVDYGYFAVQAANGRPEDLVPNGGELPKRIGLPDPDGDAARRAVEAGFSRAVLRSPASLPEGARELGREGSWVFVELPVSP